MATAIKKILSPKTPEGQLLAGLATAQRFPGVRLFFEHLSLVQQNQNLLLVQL